MSGNELPKVIDKTQADIDEAITAIKSCDLPASTKDFAISCIKLAVWFPKAVLEQKIRLSNLRKLIFGQGKKANSKGKPSKDHISLADASEPTEPANGHDSTQAAGAVENGIPATSNHTPLPGHGRLPHSAYTNTVEHKLTISNLNAGDLCPERCGGKLYRYEPGILVRVKGQNLATVHKYWIEKLRCATCDYLVQAEVPDDAGKEKYDSAFKAVLVLQKYYV